MATMRAKDWIELPTDVSISELMQHNVSNTSQDKIILEDVLVGKTAKYGAFQEQWKRSAHWLQNDIGLCPEQIVSIVSPSCVDYVLVQHSVWCAGGIVSPINHSLHPAEIAHAIDITEPSLMVVHSSSCETVEAALILCKNKGSIPQIVTIGASHPSYLSFPSEAKASGFTQAEPFSLKGGDSRLICASILLSSGTTGNPKAVMLSHYNLVSACLQLRSHNSDNWRGSQREIFFPPLSHVYALYVVTTMCCWLGSYVCILPRFDLDTYCRLMDSRKATLARLVPPVAKLLAESPIARKYSYPALEYFSCSAAPLNEKIAGDLQRAFPQVTLCQTYGCTEMSGAIVQCGVRDKNLTLISAGTPIANIELRFLDESGNDTKLGAPGEIIIRGPNLMMGYKKNEEATREALGADGWYRSGDIGYVDGSGYLVVSDRIKDVIKVKGFQVSPTELEKVLAEHTAVREAAVCGVYSEKYTSDVPQAYVILKEPVTSDLEIQKMIEDITAFVAARVSSYKQIRGGIFFEHDLPRNPTGKVMRRMLRDRATARLAKLANPKL